MAKIEHTGLDAYMKALGRLEQNAKEEICGRAIYQGADIVANSIREQLNAVKPDETFGTSDNPSKAPKTVQLQGLKKSLGISKMRNDSGYLNVKIGFGGYNSVKTKRWPKGQPNLMVARAMESGTSWMRKNPVVRNGTKKTKFYALEAMQDSVEQSIKKIMKG